MKGLFIPEITAEMFRSGCLESIEALMAEGEIYDIDYQEPTNDCISRQAAKLKVARVIWKDGESCYDFHDKCVDCLDDVPSVQPEVAKDINVPINDCISRQAAQAKIKNICDEYRLSYEDGERKAATGGSAYALGHAFDDLPPVTQQQKKIWVVTYWDKGEEPTVTAFDNRKAAECCYKAFKGSHDGCCIDETMLYHSFTIV